MDPIYPMEPTSSLEIPKGDKWLSQIKWDGVRMLTYFDGKKVELYNRKKNRRTDHYPELTTWNYFEGESAILDGEIIAMGQDGIPSFHEVMRRDGLRNLNKVEVVKKTVPITYMVFDLLYLNGEWLVERPTEERLDLLESFLLPNPYVQRVATQEDGPALFDVMKQYGMEGIIVKDRHAPYLIDGKKPTWQKIKYIRDVNAVVGGFTVKNGVANALLVGLYDEIGNLWYIGHVGTGKLTKEEWKGLTQTMKALEQETCPFSNKQGQTRETVWIIPNMVVKVHFAEWTEGRSLRQPSIQGIVEVNPDTCTFLREAPEQRKG